MTQKDTEGAGTHGNQAPNRVSLENTPANGVRLGYFGKFRKGIPFSGKVRRGEQWGREKCLNFTGLLRPQGIPLFPRLERHALPANGRIYHLRDRLQEDLLVAEGQRLNWWDDVRAPWNAPSFFPGPRGRAGCW